VRRLGNWLAIRKHVGVCSCPAKDTKEGEGRPSKAMKQHADKLTPACKTSTTTCQIQMLQLESSRRTSLHSLNRTQKHVQLGLLQTKSWEKHAAKATHINALALQSDVVMVVRRLVLWVCMRTFSKR